jgi:hypothetical protein
MADETIPPLEKYFQVSSFSKQDILNAMEGELTQEETAKIIALTETEMKWIALKMSEAFCNCCYYDQLEYYTKEVLKDV